MTDGPHLIPPPDDPDGEQAFAGDVRGGGHQGPLDVGPDLLTVEIS
jgi:hypothetical protein